MQVLSMFHKNTSKSFFITSKLDEDQIRNIQIEYLIKWTISFFEKQKYDKLLSNFNRPKNNLVIDFDNHPNKYLNWIPHLSTRCSQ